MRNEDEKIKLKGITWDHARGYDPMIATSEQFCEANEGVEIKWDKRPLQAFADYPLEKMVCDYDLIVIDHPHLGDAERNKLLLPLDGLGFDDQLTMLEKQSCGISHNSYEYNGHQWALAIDAAAQISVYRSDLISSPPVYWSEVMNLSEKGKVLWPLKPVHALMSFFTILANTGEPFGEKNKGVDINTGKYVLNEMSSLAKNVPEVCFKMDPIDAYEWLACRNTHSYIPYIYGFSNYSRKNFRPYKVDATNIPSHSHNGPVGSAIGGAGIAVSAGTTSKKTACKYAYWIASEKCQSGVYFISGGQPANMKAWDDEDCNIKSNYFFKNTKETLENCYLRPRHAGYLPFQEKGGHIIHDYLIGQKNILDTLSEINSEFEKCNL